MNQINPAELLSSPVFDLVDTQALLVRSYAYGPDGPLPLTNDPINALDAATKQYVDAGMSMMAAKPSMGSAMPSSPVAGDLWWDGSQLNIFSGVFWAPTNIPSITNPPSDGITYGRLGSGWVPVLRTSGGQMTGQLLLSADPAAALGAATKQYVDNRTGGQFVQLSGSVMSGWLTLFADPQNALHAATKQYVDQYKYLSLIDEAPPQNPYHGMLWWDPRSKQLFVYDTEDTWVMANTPTFGCDQPSPPPGAGNSFFSPIAPSNPRPGDLWITGTGNVSVWVGNRWMMISGPPGPMGPQGPPGTSVTIMGKFDHLHELQEEHPRGQAGEGYMVGEYLYVWSPMQHEWVSVGRIQGPPGTLVTISVSPPNNPKESDMWWDSLEGHMYVWYIDQDGPQWVVTN